MPQNNNQQQDSLLEGTLLALSAFGIWGLFPAIFKLFSGVNPWEVLAHRVVWSALVTIILLVGLKRFILVKSIFYQPRIVGILFVSAVLISTNWGIFIYAVGIDRVLQSSLGYYITPLMTIAIGVIFLKERLNIFQSLAVACACLGVANQIYQLGEFPWISLSLAVTFSLYGFVRKLAPVNALSGLCVETILLLLPAILYLGWIANVGQDSFLTSVQSGHYRLPIYLVLLGGITTLPLVLFAAATKRLPLSMVGFIQFITPTGHFLLAIFAFEEPFSLEQGITFVLIWTGVIAYSMDLVRKARKKA